MEGSHVACALTYTSKFDLMSLINSHQALGRFVFVVASDDSVVVYGCSQS